MHHSGIVEQQRKTNDSKINKKKRQISYKGLKSDVTKDSFKCIFQNVYDIPKILWGKELL